MKKQGIHWIINSDNSHGNGSEIAFVDSEYIRKIFRFTTAQEQSTTPSNGKKR